WHIDLLFSISNYHKKIITYDSYELQKAASNLIESLELDYDIISIPLEEASVYAINMLNLDSVSFVDTRAKKSIEELEINGIKVIEVPAMSFSNNRGGGIRCSTITFENLAYDSLSFSDGENQLGYATFTDLEGRDLS